MANFTGKLKRILRDNGCSFHRQGRGDHEIGFYPVVADTSKKPDNGRKECVCLSEGSSDLSSSRASAPSLATLKKRHRNRDDAMVAAHATGAGSYREIGEYFGHYPASVG